MNEIPTRWPVESRCGKVEKASSLCRADHTMGKSLFIHLGLSRPERVSDLLGGQAQVAVACDLVPVIT